MTALAAQDTTSRSEMATRHASREAAPSLPSEAALSPAGAGGRFVFVDALRGVAAVLVMLRHLYSSTPLYFALRLSFPRPLRVLCSDGLWGVHIFFVLSGFVIAHSLRNVVTTPHSVGRFILRRQLRLDPLYWFVLFLTLGLLFGRHVIATQHGGVVDWGLPGPGDVLLNLFYLHNVLHNWLGSSQIVSVAWTLCIEVQFYLFYILCLAIGQSVTRWMTGKGPEKNLSTVSVWLVAGLGLASLTVLNRSMHHPEPADWSPWFTSYWYYFAAGAMACWAAQGRVRPAVFGAFAALFLFCAAYWRSGGMATGAVAASLLFLVGIAGHLGDWLNYRPLQFLGRISYSLYMVHLFVVFLVMNGGFKMTHGNRPAAVFWLLLAAGLSLLAAQATYLLIEKPSLRFSERFKERRKTAAAGSPVVIPDAGAPAAAVARIGAVMGVASGPAGDCDIADADLRVSTEMGAV
jgi:peptidoglycan/LPS O-acetylase OafA/YrhL